jgi:hypothetical protein
MLRGPSKIHEPFLTYVNLKMSVYGVPFTALSGATPLLSHFYFAVLKPIESHRVSSVIWTDTMLWP